MTKLSPRAIDHTVLPVPDLETSRARFEKLGFSVAPDGQHSFGTENCCVFFGNGTFIEPLAIGHRETVEEHEREGNTFLRRDMAYRFRNGDNGFSCMVFGDKDPKQERKALKKAGYDTGKLVTVKRPGVNVNIAFAMDPRAPDMASFLCERPDGPPKFDEKLCEHANGAGRISRITLCEAVPSDFQYYLQTVTGQRNIRSHSFGMDMEAANGTITTLTNDGLQAYYGQQSPYVGRGLRMFAMDIEVADRSKVRKLLSNNDIPFSEIGLRTVVSPALGQGCVLAFVENNGA